MTITCKWSCNLCGVKRVDIQVPARQEESVTAWMDATVKLVAAAHRRRSPGCRARELSELMIPNPVGSDKIGGPNIQ